MSKCKYYLYWRCTQLNKNKLVYRHATETKETNISNKRNVVKNPNWLEADQLAIYKAWPRIWTRNYRETNPACSRVRVLNPGPPDYNIRALNHSATLLSTAAVLFSTDKSWITAIKWNIFLFPSLDLLKTISTKLFTKSLKRHVIELHRWK